MKLIFSILFSLIFFVADATNYYVAQTGGDDTRSSSTAQNSNTPWRTISKINSFFTSLNGGDTVFFNKGDTWNETLTILKSGGSGNPIVFSSFGSGAKPIISGFTTLTLSSIGSNKYESQTLSGIAYMNVVTVGGTVTPMGRYPNSGTWLSIDSHSGTTTITDAALPTSPNWAGADVAIRVKDWQIDDYPITAHSGTTLTYTGSTAPTDGYGYFIQNSASTLDANNEWYFTGTKVQIYSNTGSAPSNVKAATLDKLITNAGFDYITVDGLAFEGCNLDAVNFTSTPTNCIVRNCDFNKIGRAGVTVSTGNNIRIESCNFNNCLSGGVNFGSTSPTTNYVGYCSFYNIGIIPGNGVATSNSSSGSGKAISSNNDNNTYEYNIIKNTGYNGISIGGDNILCQYNTTDSTCLIMDDGGGIYINPGYGSSNRKVWNNIVTNCIGSIAGANKSATENYGIYVDNGGNGVNIMGNTVYNTKRAIYLHGGANCSMRLNTCFNNTNSMYFGDYSTTAMTNDTVRSNIFISSYGDQGALKFPSLSVSTVNNIGKIDSNIYAKVYYSADSLIYESNNSPQQLSFAAWKAAHTTPGYDIHSTELSYKYGSQAITDTSINFIYNTTAASLPVTLNNKYTDASGVAYNSGSITLAPFSSKVLFYTGELDPSVPVSGVKIYFRKIKVKTD